MKRNNNPIYLNSGTLFKTFGLLIVIRMIFRNYFSETFGIIYLFVIVAVGAFAYITAINEKKEENPSQEDELLDE